MSLPLKFPLSPAMFLSDMFHNEGRRWQIGEPWEKFWKGLSILYSSGSHSFIDTENSCPKIQHKSLNYLTISGFRSLTLCRKLYSYMSYLPLEGQTGLSWRTLLKFALFNRWFPFIVQAHKTSSSFGVCVECNQSLCNIWGLLSC